MEESGSNLKRAALYGVAGLMTAAIGASAVSVLAAEDDKKPEQKPAAQSAPATPKPAEPAPAPAPKPAPVTQAEPAPPAPPAPEPAPAPPVAQPVAPRVMKPVVQKRVVQQPVVAAVKVEEPPAAPDAGPSSVSSASVQVSGTGKGEVAVHASPSKPVKKPSPTDEALKKAKSEATEAKKKVKHAEKQLDEAKKDYDKKKGEIKKIQKQQKEEKKAQPKPKPKPPVEPVLTVKTSPDMEKRLKVHTSKHKSGKKVTISVSASAHSG